MTERRVFHLALPVNDLAAAKRFYMDVLGARVGRESSAWLDVLVWGHQLTLHHRPDETLPRERQGKRHFGVVLPWEEWERLMERVEAAGAFLHRPELFQPGTEDEHGKFYLEDPSHNVVELKAYRNATATLRLKPECEPSSTQVPSRMAESVAALLDGFSTMVRFAGVTWAEVPDEPGVYIIYDGSEVLYVGMAGRDGSGSLRRRLRDHSSGQVVNMFAQYLFLARVQFVLPERVTHPRAAKAACRQYILERCSLRFRATATGSEARALEKSLRSLLKPVLNGT